jgi:alkylhydroperoxidase family enzyme
VRGAIEALETSGLGEPDKALLRFVTKLNDEAAKIGEADIAALHAVGWTDEAIYDAVMVCGLFNFYNRWIDGTGVHPLSDEYHRMAGKRMAVGGYTRTTEE